MNILDTDKSVASESLLLPATEPGHFVRETANRGTAIMDQESNAGIEGTLQQRFGPRDLMALQKSLEKEIDAYEVLLAEEIEKRKKFRVRFTNSTCVITGITETPLTLIAG